MVYAVCFEQSLLLLVVFGICCEPCFLKGFWFSYINCLAFFVFDGSGLRYSWRSSAQCCFIQLVVFPFVLLSSYYVTAAFCFVSISA